MINLQGMPWSEGCHQKEQVFGRSVVLNGLIHNVTPTLLPQGTFFFNL